MQTLALNGTWELSITDGTRTKGQIPGSVYSFLLGAGLMPDPYWRDNELKVLPIMENDFTFNRSFVVEEAFLAAAPVFLRCEGLDTLCTLFVNGQRVAETDNMHRTWEFDVTGLLKAGINEISVFIASPTKWIKEKDAEWHVGGSKHAMLGFPHLRKSHCMFGWDWGIRLPDAGIWRSISLVAVGEGRLLDWQVRQRHEAGRVYLCPRVEAEGRGEVRLTLTAPDGKQSFLPVGQETPVADPQLWWPNGLGEQPLYSLMCELIVDGEVVDRQERRIGLRTLSVARHKDEWGESFAHIVNGVEFFAMGADYIPEDGILSRVTPGRTRQLLEDCRLANFNTVRVWGGGYYPDDWFFDDCDELGLVVWQDMMFACANYPLDFEFEDNITAEIRDNVRRLRHHASLGLWCGNNEMEMLAVQYAYDGSDETKAHYIRMYEHIIPHILRVEDPDTFYWPGSPSSGGSFDDPNSFDRGDVHYWDVWHASKPFEEFRKYHFRYASEFGFQAFPGIKTVESFTLPEDRNIFSRVMEMHQRNEGANGKIIDYLAKTYLYPTGFDTLLYASQLLQAEAIRYGVEHWRRFRGRCMGAIYWQLNDNWPVASWASVDYYGRWKALHYFAKRFFAPVAISCSEEGETFHRTSVVMEPSTFHSTAHLCVANETMAPVAGEVRWALRDSASNVVEEGCEVVTVPALDKLWLEQLDFGEEGYLENHLSYSFVVEGEAVSAGSVLFTAPKHYHFRDPQLSYTIEGDMITISAAAYAKSVEIECMESDILLSDNWFDMEAGSVRVKVLRGKPKELVLRSVYDIK